MALNPSTDPDDPVAGFAVWAEPLNRLGGAGSGFEDQSDRLVVGETLKRPGVKAVLLFYPKDDTPAVNRLWLARSPWYVAASWGEAVG